MTFMMTSLLPILLTAALICTATGLNFGNFINGDNVESDYISKLRFQHHVYIKTYSKTCSGALIGERFVLTAAQCVNDVKLVMGIAVYAGTFDISEKMLRTASRQTVKNIYIPPGFQNYSFVRKGKEIKLFLNDIAVLKLDNKFHHRNPIGSIKLPKGHMTYDLESTQVSGYGWDETQIVKNAEGNLEIDRTADGKLKWARVVKIDHDSPIENIIEAHSNGRTRVPGHGPCIGDIGSPLSDGYDIIGILSAFNGNPTESANDIAYYTEVSSYLDFIKKAMNNKIEGIYKTKASKVSKYEKL